MKAVSKSYSRSAVRRQTRKPLPLCAENPGTNSPSTFHTSGHRSYGGVRHYSYRGGLSRAKMGCSVAAALLENVFMRPMTGPCQMSRAAISLATYTVR